MSGGKDWLLPPSVPTFNVYAERKEDRARKKRRESERREATWSEFPFLSVSNHNHLAPV